MQDPKPQEVVTSVTQLVINALTQEFPDMPLETQEAPSGNTLVFGPFPTFIISVGADRVGFLVDAVCDPTVAVQAYESIRDAVPACNYAGCYAVKADASGMTVEPQEVADLRFYHTKRAVAARLAAEAVEQAESAPKILVPDNKIIA